ncbi:SCO6745 family protein [Actinomycetota bacterium Odt1-20B]
MTTVTAAVADSRALWLRAEPPHAVVYFAEECRALSGALGLKGFWMGYFAARTAPLGAVGPGAATAALGVFAPGMVARALPSAWELAPPARVVEERAARTARALRALVPDAERIAAEVNPALATAVAQAPPLGRPLFAANRDLCTAPQGADPVQELWQLLTCVREFRGDAHLAVLADRGLDGCEALVLAAATGRVGTGSIRQDRGWSEDEWEEAVDRLRARGLVAGGAGGGAGVRVTDQGLTERELIEDATDRLAARLLDPLTEKETHALLSGLEPLSRSVRDSGVLPFPNPMGLPKCH